MKKILATLIGFICASATFAQEYSMGMEFDDDNYKKAERKMTLLTRDYRALPTSYSMREYVPNVLSQKGGTCVGWSTTYYGRTILEAKGQNEKNKLTISNNAFAPLSTYTLIKNHTGCEDGTSIYYALQALTDKGAPRKSDFDVDCPSSVPSDILAKATAYKIKGFATLFDSDDTNIEMKKSAMKKSLVNGNPVIIGMKCPKSFHGAKDMWQPTENPNGNFGGHAMCVTGYDDAKYGGAFEIVNSWGTWWGNQGYVWIRYNDFFDFTKYAYEMIAFPTQKPANQTDMAGEIAFRLSTGNNMQVTYNKQTGNIGYYKVNQAYTSGTQFRIMISNNEPAFVYAFGSDLTNEVFTIFPHKPNISPALNYAGNNIALPSEQHFVRMNDTVGKDFMCVLYSKEKLDIDDIKNRVAEASGTFAQKVQSVLGTDLVNISNTQFQNNQMKFSAKSSGKSVVALMVEITHE
jgi:C1A family cysteine protease